MVLQWYNIYFFFIKKELRLLSTKSSFCNELGTGGTSFEDFFEKIIRTILQPKNPEKPQKKKMKNRRVFLNRKIWLTIKM